MPSRALRLLQLCIALSEGETVTASMLANSFEVTERTIYRDIDTLARAGLQVKGAPGVGYRLDEPFQVAPLLLTRAELRALVEGARAVQAGGDPELARVAQTLLAKAQAIARRG